MSAPQFIPPLTGTVSGAFIHPSLLDAVPANLAVLDSDGRFIFVNEAWKSFARQKALPDSSYELGTDYLAVCRLAGEAFADSVAEGLRLLLDGSAESYVFDHPCHMPDSRGAWYRLTLKRLPGGSVMLMHLDITEFKQAEARSLRLRDFHAASSSIHELMARGHELREIYQSACRIAVEKAGLLMAWIGLVNDEGEVRPASVWGKDEGYVDMLRINTDPDSPLGRGPVGRACRTGQPALCHDIETDDGFFFTKAEALARGYRSCAVFPLKSGGRVTGIMALYSGIPYCFQGDEVQVLGALAESLSLATHSHELQQARAAAEQARHESEEQLRATFEQAAVGMAHVAADGSFLRVNEKLCEILGYTAEELDTLTFTTLTPPADQHICARLMHDLLGGSCTSASLEKRYLRKDGTHIWVNVIATIAHRQDGSPYLIIVVEDIRPRKTAEERLREQAALLDKAQDAILVRDLEHHILFWNKSAERLYGWTAEQALEKRISELLYNDATAFLKATAHTLQRGEWTGEIEQLTQDGRTVIVEGHWSLVRDDEGAPKAILAINTDVTQRKKIEQQYLRAQRMESIGTLAGGIAHDLNNVLSPIMMSIELLKLGEQNPARLQVLDTIETSAHRGADMVRQVLSFARGFESRQIQVRVQDVLREVEKIANETFLKTILVSATIQPDLWPVLGDPTQLHQMMLNLCVNARDAMPDGGTLSFTATNTQVDAQFAGMNLEAQPGPHVLIQVEDSGVGMPPEVLERIFEPFFTTKELGKGTGLGLSTTQAIVKSHGGFLRVSSEPGKGTCFQVYLPALQSAAGTSASELQALPTLPHGAGELILVVDDEEPVRQITRHTLETFGYRVITAADGTEATATYAMRRHEIAVTLTDMMMPIMDGSATIRAILRINPLARIIAASGLNVSGISSRAMEAGVRHFIPKPYTAETLLTTLHEVLHGVK